MQVCPALPQDGAFLSGMLGYVDCQARTIGAGGYLALASPGSAVGLLLGTVLTIFIAFIGYRMIFGDLPTGRDLVLAAVRIGVVLMLATSWPAFQTLAYNVAMDGPTTLASEIGGAGGLPGSNGDLVGHLQAIDDEMVELTYVGVNGALQASRSTANTANTQTSAPTNTQPQYQQLIADPVRNAEALATSRTVYLTATIAAFASVRLVAGLLLALGPLFALFLLFDATRGLFEGWIRTLLATTLGALATTIVLGVEIAVLEPWLGGILQDRYAQVGRPEVPVELMVVMLVFGLVLLAALVIVARAAYGFRLPGPWRHQVTKLLPSSIDTVRREGSVAMMRSTEIDQRSRAVAIADAVAATQRRETMLAGPGWSNLSAGRRIAPGGSSYSAQREMISPAQPLGSSWRRARNRISASAGRRDRRA